MKKFFLAMLLSFGLVFGMSTPAEAGYLYAYTDNEGTDTYVVSETIRCEPKNDNTIAISLNILVVNPKYQGFESYEFVGKDDEWYWSRGAGTTPSHLVKDYSQEWGILCATYEYLTENYDEED